MKYVKKKSFQSKWPYRTHIIELIIVSYTDSDAKWEAVAFIRCHRDKYSLPGPGLHPVYRLDSLGSGAVQRNGRLKGHGIMAGYKRAVIVITGVYKARAALYGPNKSFIRPSVAQSEKERFLFEKRPSGLFSRWPRTHTPRSVPHSPNFIIFFFSSLLFFV